MNMRDSQSRAFTLFEVMIALGIFMLVAVGSMNALGALVDSVRLSRQLSSARNRIDQVLSEARVIRLPTGRTVLDDEGDGFKITREVAPLLLANDDQESLQNMFKITVLCAWKQGEEERHEEAEIWIYQP